MSKENGNKGSNMPSGGIDGQGVDAAESAAHKALPLRDLIKVSPSANARVNVIMDTTSCGLADIEALRKRDIALIVLERFVLKHLRLPKDGAEVDAAIKAAGTMFL